MRYTVDAFTPKSEGSKFPENSWDTDDVYEIAHIVHNCGRKIAGISVIEVRCNEPHEEPAVPQ